MIIAQISDTHIALDVEDANQRIRDFEAVITDINMLDPAPDLIIHTGDIVHNGRQDEYTKAVEILATAKAPVYCMVGNKDHRINMRAAFSQLQSFSPDSEFIDYAVDDFPVKCIMLDTLHEGSNKGNFCQKRMQNLLGMLDDDRTKSILVFTHHPPCEIFVGPDRIHFETIEAMTELRKTLLNSGRVTSIFSGHVHRSTTGFVEDIPVTVSSSVATTLRWDQCAEHMKSRPVYYLHEVDENNVVTTQTRITAV